MKGIIKLGYLGTCPKSWIFYKLNSKKSIGNEGGQILSLNTHIPEDWRIFARKLDLELLEKNKPNF